MFTLGIVDLGDAENSFYMLETKHAFESSMVVNTYLINGNIFTSIIWLVGI